MERTRLLVLVSVAVLWTGGLCTKSPEVVNNGHSSQGQNNNDAQNSSATKESAVPPTLKFSDIFIEQQGNHSETGQLGSVKFGYETLWSNGSVTVSTALSAGSDTAERGSRDELDRTWNSIYGEPEDVLSNAEDEKIDQVFHTARKSAAVRKRMRRLIFPPDDRLKLNTSSTAQRFPFSAVAKTSTGCTATFISPQHALTSAHCVHDGKQYLVNTSSALKIGFLRRRGRFKWIAAQSIVIAQEWKQLKSVPHDYAVVKLKRPHKRQFLPLAVLPKRRHLRIHFASFPGDKKSNSLWYTRCSARSLSQVILSRCDAFTGSSGSGVYIRIRSRKSDDLRVIVGVLSGSGKVQLPDRKMQPFNFATKLSNAQVEHICQLIKRDFSKCTTWRPKGGKAVKRRPETWSD